MDEFITSNIPKGQQDKMQGYFYEMLYGVMNAALDETIRRYGLPEWRQDEARNRFLLHSMDAYTGLTEYPAPMLLQLDGFSEVRSSGLQMTRSPGALLVYLGSVLLVWVRYLCFMCAKNGRGYCFQTAKSVLLCLRPAANGICRRNFQNTSRACNGSART
ncbi:cytochrome biogenesis protein [Neisseria gonorrhoeae]|uniref:Cytochrome biogenesis protein n=1 Tax=Neisseria gonorrhoeae TaxID=485 RepID=A0A378W1U6_NEIGO|nr:cytochrome biogenesis protein [Neisseria gonorrhoeae]